MIDLEQYADTDDLLPLTGNKSLVKRVHRAK